MARHFSPDVFAFLRDLAANNDRTWFQENKQRYEESVRQPALDFITDFVEPLSTLSPHFVADSRTVGGSLFRLHRDTRFSKDKTPYKVNTGMHFRHDQARDAHAPGYYVHLEPRNCFIGAGLWTPEPKVAQQIRLHIVAHADEWTQATRRGPITDHFSLGGDQLKRPPRGIDVDPADPLMDDLRRTSFIATSPLTQRTVVSRDFAEVLRSRFDLAGPMMALLCDAVGVPF